MVKMVYTTDKYLCYIKVNSYLNILDMWIYVTEQNIKKMNTGMELCLHLEKTV
jgi:hypothetical protein